MRMLGCGGCAHDIVYGAFIFVSHGIPIGRETAWLFNLAGFAAQTTMSCHGASTAGASNIEMYTQHDAWMVWPLPRLEGLLSELLGARTFSFICWQAIGGST